MVLDCDRLAYSNSTGLRVILRLKRRIEDTVLTNIHPELYDILNMTGFTDMMEVHKAYCTLSVDGCEVIGQGVNGKVYRIGPDTVVKVYLNPDALPEIRRERALARSAFIAGVPTAIPRDVFWAVFLRDYLPAAETERLYALIDACRSELLALLPRVDTPAF